jgi:hypothetical protein
MDDQAPPSLSETRVVFVHESGSRLCPLECIANFMQMSQGRLEPCGDHGLGFESKFAFAEPAEAFPDSLNFRSHVVPKLFQHFKNFLGCYLGIVERFLNPSLDNVAAPLRRPFVPSV